MRCSFTKKKLFKTLQTFQLLISWKESKQAKAALLSEPNLTTLKWWWWILLFWDMKALSPGGYSVVSIHTRCVSFLCIVQASPPSTYLELFLTDAFFFPFFSLFLPFFLPYLKIISGSNSLSCLPFPLHGNNWTKSGEIPLIEKTTTRFQLLAVCDHLQVALPSLLISLDLRSLQFTCVSPKQALLFPTGSNWFITDDSGELVAPDSHHRHQYAIL